MFKSEEASALLMVMVTPLLLKQIKSAETSYFISFRSLLMFDIWMLDCKIIALELFVLIGMIICFLKESLVVILSFSLPFSLVLLVTLWILIILSEDNLGKVFLILIISSIFLLEVCMHKQFFKFNN